MYQIYSKALQSVNVKWDIVIPDILDKRVQEGFNALLPKETLEQVKLTCINLSIEKCFSKVNEWRTTNMSGVELFCKDIPAEAAKHKSSHNKMVIIPLKIDINRISPALVFEKLQQLIHRASVNYPALTMEDVLQEIKLFYKFLDEQNVTGNMYKTAAFMLLQLVVILGKFLVIISEVQKILLFFRLMKKFLKYLQCTLNFVNLKQNLIDI